MPPQTPSLVWTPDRENFAKIQRSPGYTALLQARLLELALGSDGKVAIEALKLLVGGVSSDQNVVDPKLADLPVEILEDAYERAAYWIESLGGDGGEGSADLVAANARAQVFAALRPTDYAELPDGPASLADHERAGDGGAGPDPLSDHQHAAETWQERDSLGSVSGVVSGETSE